MLSGNGVSDGFKPPCNTSDTGSEYTSNPHHNVIFRAAGGGAEQSRPEQSSAAEQTARRPPYKPNARVCTCGGGLCL